MLASRENVCYCGCGMLVIRDRQVIRDRIGMRLERSFKMNSQSAADFKTQNNTF